MLKLIIISLVMISILFVVSIAAQEELDQSPPQPLNIPLTEDEFVFTEPDDLDNPPGLEVIEYKSGEEHPELEDKHYLVIFDNSSNIKDTAILESESEIQIPDIEEQFNEEQSISQSVRRESGGGSGLRVIIIIILLLAIAAYIIWVKRKPNPDKF